MMRSLLLVSILLMSQLDASGPISPTTVSPSYLETTVSAVLADQTATTASELDLSMAADQTRPHSSTPIDAELAIVPAAEGAPDDDGAFQELSQSEDLLPPPAKLRRTNHSNFFSAPASATTSNIPRILSPSSLQPPLPSELSGVNTASLEEAILRAARFCNRGEFIVAVQQARINGLPRIVIPATLYLNLIAADKDNLANLLRCDDILKLSAQLPSLFEAALTLPHIAAVAIIANSSGIIQLTTKHLRATLNNFEMARTHNYVDDKEIFYNIALSLIQAGVSVDYVFSSEERFAKNIPRSPLLFILTQPNLVLKQAAVAASTNSDSLRQCEEMLLKIQVCEYAQPDSQAKQAHLQSIQISIDLVRERLHAISVKT